MPKSKARAKRRKALKRKENAYRSGGMGVGALLHSFPVFGSRGYSQAEILTLTVADELRLRCAGMPESDIVECAAFISSSFSSDVRGFAKGIFLRDYPSFRRAFVQWVNEDDQLRECFVGQPQDGARRVWERVVERCAAAGVPVV